MIIKNANVFTEEGKFVKQDIYIKGGQFVKDEAEASADEVIDAEGCFAVPGLTDIHFHGCVGYDFCDGTEEAITKIAEYQASIGVTSIVPATMTLGEDVLKGICETAAVYRKTNKNEKAADLCGINMEGPFLAESKKGAQNSTYLHKPDGGMYDRLNEASDHLIKLVAIAPEVEGAMDFIQAKKGEVVLSTAHTAADYETAMEAFEKGATHVTHLYNAMNPYTHRAPGLIGAAADSGAEVELISDGVHVHPSVVRNTFKLFGEDKVILISDSMMATGLDDGDYSLGGQAVKVVGNLATLADGTIAGSATNLMDCVRTAVLKMHIPLETAIKCAASNPAKSVGIYDKYGSITPGKIANVVLLKKDDLALETVILRGKKLS
ncbi:MAG: N-acetylglucosamine-6-phosphate deacetylase [Clostridiales bacterium]|nr:N-acetylglucosamine-6-phosphate deacetylase [Clostridiales bacterium]